jgi:sporulation protein YlmC with PRC-barrel domain
VQGSPTAGPGYREGIPIVTSGRETSSVSTDTPGRLLSIVDTGRTVADPAEDVRGKAAYDSAGEEIGKVDDLFVDDEETRVRFLQISTGGFLGIGKDRFLVPVDAVSSVTEDRVTVDRDRARLTDVPGYDPELAEVPAYYANLYGWWGYGPYWATGYVPPTLPRI